LDPKSPSESKKRLALAIVDFLGSSLKDGTLTADDAESIEIAQNCIAETFHVDPSNEAAMKDALGGQSLASIYSVYEKLKGKTAGGAGGAGASTTSGTSATAGEQAKPQSSTATSESDKLKSQGNAAMGRKEYDSAIDLYSKALGLVPNNPIYLSNRAAAYSASGQHIKAAADAELAVEVDPKYARAWSRLGLARYELGDAKGAVEAYEKGIDAEGSGGSDAMKRGLETARQKVEEMNRAEDAPPAEEIDTAPGASRGGGLPDLSALGSMFGGGAGGGMPDLGSLMSNPMFANMAQSVMSNPDMMNNIMNNPRMREMAENMGGGGGMPDMASLMSDPNIAEM
jgi:small glutamine-rich tetratricopeptide repeat-containing protein alpha